ncbi:MAG: hypothetical protein JSS27_13040 [Planctomycetes bacterium]|nr:hypothetical protein [Planctomycetota bacterium]
MPIINQVESSLAAIPAPSYGSLRIDEADAGLRFIANLSAIDTLAVAFEEFKLTSDRLAAADVGQLRAVADELSRRLNYLLEPIQAIEIDSERCVVQMRSVPPTKDDGRTSYYELIVRKPGELSLCRYATTAAAGRQVILAQVTREVFLRLVRDFAAVA